MSTAAGFGASTIARIRGPSILAAVFVALFVPVILLVNGVAVIGHPWFVRAEFAHLGGDRDVQLAKQALEAAMPWGEGEEALGPSYNARERTHLEDVRTLLLALFAAHAAGVLALAGLALHRRTRTIAVRAIRWGVALTLALCTFVAIYVAVSPVGFLGGFHRFFFEGDSWRFAETDTLRRLFPDRFWADTAIVLGALTAAQAVALWIAARRRRQASSRPARTTAA